MASAKPTLVDKPKRKRGAQPGNKNAKGNRGNPHPRRNFGNKGGPGAPTGNQYARKKPKPKLEILLDDYKHLAEADKQWLTENAAELEKACFTDDNQRDPAIFCSFAFGLTPETIAEQGLEWRYGLAVMPEAEWEERAA